MKNLFNLTGKRRKVICPECLGLGELIKYGYARGSVVVSYTKRVTCPRCNGKKYIYIWRLP